MIYFDNSATTSLHPEVIDAMLPFLKEEYGNPSSKYYTLAENAKKSIEEARTHVAKLLGCEADEVVFTSGATESNNMILKGLMDYYQQNEIKLVTTSVEHPSILETAKFLQTKGFEVDYLGVDRYGRVSIEELESVLNKDSNRKVLVSIIWGNNELGSLNDIEKLSNFCKRKGAFFHTDATQVLGKINLHIGNLGIGFLSCSAHKIHGPKGIGACVIKKQPSGSRTFLTPLLHGGGQENQYRSGTLSTHNIIGMGKAAEIAFRDIEDTKKHLSDLEGYFISKVTAIFPEIVRLNSDRENKIPGVVNLRFEGINNEMLIRNLKDEVAISTGSACSSTKPSHVLLSIGLTLDEVRSSIRVSFSRFNNKEDVDKFLSILAS